ncbi:Ubiquitin domain-containing protein ubfd1 [Rhizophlyctis rosea]|uniref:Ubiquitin domain-containing protein ubfd1 n=1 Tax=Rhizophlyctis rosea TaxID=64517 RepID=A0AAD5X3P5_9FUNG|nr:Ubiquitin domain-containing protein ubfd1 [Rhizophlyctis rosea]
MMTDTPPTTTQDAKRKGEDLEQGPQITFKVTHQKQTYDITMADSKTIADLKTKIEEVSGVHVNLQKILYKGMPKDTQTLSEAKITNGVKVMLMASKVEDVIKIASGPAASASSEPKATTTPKQSWSTQTEHAKIIKKGKPDDATPGLKGTKQPLPTNGVTGLLNGRGLKTRLTFKAESAELQIGTNERTQKVPYNSISTVTSQAIEGMEEYHILALQLGPTEK